MSDSDPTRDVIAASDAGPDPEPTGEQGLARAEPGETPIKATGSRRAPLPWKHYVVLVAVVVVFAALMFLLVTAFAPRIWANTISRQVNHSMASGIGWGLFYGVVFTTVPLLVAGLAFVRRWKRIATRIVFLIVGVLVAIPNLLTLAIVVGTGNAAHDAERVLAVDAPFFRGSTAIGAVVGVVAAVAMWVLTALARHRSAELHELRAEQKAAKRAAKQR